MDILEHLLNSNQNWAERIKSNKPDFFSRLYEKQTPKILWIGCSDSRIPETQILDQMPGDVFTHRNIGNLIAEDNLCTMAVVSHAVNELEINDIVICGHYGCSAIEAVLLDSGLGLVHDWVKPLIELKVQHIGEIQSLEGRQKTTFFSELNVEKQVENLSESNLVQSIWKQGKQLTIYGLIYDLKTGLLKELSRQSSAV